MKLPQPVYSSCLVSGTSTTDGRGSRCSTIPSILFDDSFVSISDRGVGRKETARTRGRGRRSKKGTRGTPTTIIIYVRLDRKFSLVSLPDAPVPLVRLMMIQNFTQQLISYHSSCILTFYKIYKNLYRLVVVGSIFSYFNVSAGFIKCGRIYFFYEVLLLFNIIWFDPAPSSEMIGWEVF